MKRLVAVLVVLPLVLTALLASPAEAKRKKKYQVSVSVATKTDVRSCLRVSGRVRGPGAQGAKVRIKVRKPGSSRFATVKSATVKKRGKYSACVRLARPGAHQILVKKPRSAVRKAGVSVTRTVTAWAWLDLTRQRRYDTYPAETRVGTVSIAGRRYSPAMTFGPTAYSSYYTAGMCDAARARVGLPAGVGVPDALWGRRLADRSYAGSEFKVEVQPNQAPRSLRVSLTGYELLSFGAYDRVVAVVAPQAHCMVPALGDVPPVYWH